jgi:hypothetical protein
MPAITKSDVQQSLPIEQNSIGKSPRAIKSIFLKAQPKDSVKIQKIAVLKQKTDLNDWDLQLYLHF